MDRLQEAKLKIALKEIIGGFSVLHLPEYKEIYVKHLSFVDTASIDTVYAEAYNAAVAKGLQSSDERIADAVRDELWTNDQEKRLKDIPKEVDNLKLTRSKVHLTKQRESLNKEIEKLNEELSRLSAERDIIIGYSAESYANKKTNEYFVYFTFRKSDLEDFYFSREEYNELEEAKLTDLVIAYNTYSARFTSDEIKKIAISPSFMSMINVAGEDVYSFYGKPVIALTNRQIEVYHLGRYFRRLLSETQVPLTDELIENPELLIETAEAQKSAEEFSKNADKPESAGLAIVGATKEDLKKMGLDNQSGVSLEAEAAKNGGSLDMKALMALHGL